jgi:hypothetical protein
MADPFTMAFASAAASTIFKGLGNISASRNERARLKFQRQISLQNAAMYREDAELADKEADRAHFVGQVNALDQGFAARAQMGAQRVAQAASGFDLSSTSFRRARKIARNLARRDQERMIDDAAQTARQIKMNAVELRRKAVNEEIQASGAKMNSNIVRDALPLQLASTLVSGASEVNNLNLRKMGAQN